MESGPPGSCSRDAPLMFGLHFYLSRYEAWQVRFTRSGYSSYHCYDTKEEEERVDFIKRCVESKERAEPFYVVRISV